MTLMTLCALVPLLCRLAAAPSVRAALQLLPSDREADWLPFTQAMREYSAEASQIVSLLGGGALSPGSLRQCFSTEALAFFHLCGQCAPAEMLDVLTRCTVPPTAEALALLIGLRRRENAMHRYGLQLLWRLNGDAALPDALSLFPDEALPASSAPDIFSGIFRRLKEVQL